MKDWIGTRRSHFTAGGSPWLSSGGAAGFVSGGGGGGGGGEGGGGGGSGGGGGHAGESMGLLLAITRVS